MKQERRSLVLAATMMATFMAAVETSIVATAMPTIVADLGNFRLFSWVFAAYLLAQAVTIPIYGRLADLYGRKRVFFAGAGLFLTGSTLCGFAHNMPSLIVFRVLQGLGAGAVQPVAYTIVGDIYTPAERARVQGFLSAVFGVAALIGPSLGAFLVALAWWPVVFWVNLPIGAAAIAMLAIFFRERPHGRTRRIDYLGSLLLMGGGGLLMMALVQAHSLGGGMFTLCLVAGGSVLALLVWHESRTAEPILPAELWRNRLLTLGCLGSISIGAAMIGVTAFLPTYVQGVMGLSAFSAGVALGAMSLSWAAASVAAGRLMIRTSYRTTAILGGIALVLGGIGFLAMTPDSGPAWPAGCALTVGIGMGFCNTTYLVSSQAASTAAGRGSATSAIMFMRIVGQAAAAALFGAVVNSALYFSSQHADVANHLMQPELRQSLSSAELATLAAAMSGALKYVYALVTLLGIVVLSIGWNLPARVGARDPVAETRG
jgi:EmrB/QacA subfamily drug resistance transporter